MLAYRKLIFVAVLVFLLTYPMVSLADTPSGAPIFAPDGSHRVWVRSEFGAAELWLAAENTSARRVLFLPGEIIGEVRWSPDSRAIAFIRTPLGSDTDAAAELWRFDIADGRLTRLTRNNLPDHSPHWSANGRTITVWHGAKTITLPADRLSVDDTPAPTRRFSPLNVTHTAALTAPAEIRVIHSEYNTCRADTPVGQIDTIPFEEYVKRVVPNEVFPSWDAAALQAQAVAARTYAWYQYLRDPAAEWHVTDWVDYQYMCDTTDPRTDAAVDATAGEYISYQNAPIVAMYSAENSSPTRSSPYVEYLRAVDDPVSFGEPRNGHGYGMGQWGAQRWASQYGWDYAAILRHYYWNVSLTTGTVLTDTAAPKISLVEPWRGFYVTGNRLGVVFNAFDDTGTIAETRLQWTTPFSTETIFQTTGAADRESFAIAPPVLTDGTPLTLTAVVSDTAGNHTESNALRLEVDRSDPVAQWVGGSMVLTGSVALTPAISAHDDTAGVQWLAVGDVDWLWEGETFNRTQSDGSTVGQVITDITALNGQAVQATVAHDSPGVWTVGGIFLPGGKAYRAYFRLKVSDTTRFAPVAELFAHTDTARIGLTRLNGTDFRQADVYQEFHMDFVLPNSGSMAMPLTLEVLLWGTADITFDRVAIFAYPVPFQPDIPAGAPLNLRAKVIDGAGNVSADLLAFRATQAVYLPLVLK